MIGSLLRRSALELSHRYSYEATILAACTSSTLGSQRGVAMTVGSAVPDFDPKDIPSPSTRAPQGWWVDPAFDTVQAAYAEFDKSLKRHQVIRQRHVQEVIRRCESADDLALAMTALEKLRRHRASALNHEPFNNHTCTLMMEKVANLQAYTVAVEVLKRNNQLGLQPTSLQVERLLRSNKQDLRASLDILEAARGTGIRPTSDHAYSIARTAVRSGQRGKGIKAVKEMAYNGIPIRASVWKALKLAEDGSPLPTAAAGVAANTISSENDGLVGDVDPQDGSSDGDSPNDQTAPADDGAPPGVAS